MGWSGQQPTHSTADDQPLRSPATLIVGLSIVVLTVAVLQTAVVPVLGIIADQLDASTVAVSWAVTANLLAAAAATPLIGRLADLHSKKRVLLWVLAIVLVGSVLAATTSSLALLIVGRVLQAASFALYPDRHRDPARGAHRRPHGVGDVGALRNAGLRRRDRDWSSSAC